jgi:long-chain fatty acid transport protein
LGAAYVANANGADASYYNPANMVWNDDVSEFELALTYINLPKVKYSDTRDIPYSAESKEEKFYMPTFHYVSPAVGNWRFGLSVVAPGGLSKRWDNAYQMLKAEEFTLKVIEINPTAAYKINDKFAVGFGLRGVYSKGMIKFQDELGLSGNTYKNEMEADSIDFGYNLALSYKPIENLTLSTTYRSKVDLTVKGDSKGWLVHPTLGYIFDTNAKTEVPLPAVWTLAAAYTMSKTTIEFVFDRTYWSSYEELNFDFDDAVVEGAFGSSKPKNWKDVNAYRIGVTHKYSDSLKLMAGFSIDKTPAPDETLGFELPDSDAYNYSAGLEYKVNQNMKVGLSYLYSDKDERTVNNGYVNGTFSNSSAHLVTASLKYRF